jgi:hypothetical protein
MEDGEWKIASILYPPSSILHLRYCSAALAMKPVIGKNGLVGEYLWQKIKQAV